MKKLIVLLTFLLLSNAITLQAQINGKRWFAEFSAGGTRSSGTFEMKKFYDPNTSISVDFGYMVSPHVGIVPFSVNHYVFRFNKTYLENYWDNTYDEYFKGIIERRLEAYRSNLAYNSQESVTYFDAASKMKVLSFMPAFAFFSPGLAGFRSFFQVGAGFYYTKVSMAISYGFAKGDWKETKVTNSKQRNINLVL